MIRHIAAGALIVLTALFLMAELDDYNSRVAVLPLQASQQ